MNQQLTVHFASNEFEEGGDAIPADCMNIFAVLCAVILEPIRIYVARPITITSGYRSAQDNKLAHGVSDSEHVATPKSCAADFTFGNVYGSLISVRSAFDWIRRSPTLPFHQVILEHGANGSSIIHVSINLTKPGIRQALEGATHNSSPYIAWEVVPYVPINTTGGQENA